MNDREHSFRHHQFRLIQPTTVMVFFAFTLWICSSSAVLAGLPTFGQYSLQDLMRDNYGALGEEMNLDTRQHLHPFESNLSLNGGNLFQKWLIIN